MAAPIIGLGLARPSDNGTGESGRHSDYFGGVQTALQQAGLYRPTLVIDQARLNHNVDTLTGHIPADKNFRVVAKSLPSMKLLQSVMQRNGTNRLMVFHQPFLNRVATDFPEADILLGKPMPIAAVKRFFDFLKPNGFKPDQQIQWLVDSLERLAEYREFARNSNTGVMQINLEIDVGLHRGGFTMPENTAKAIQLLQDEPNMSFSGFMGYEPHITKIPSILGGQDGALQNTLDEYAAHMNAAKEILGSDYDPNKLTYNIGGSKTYQLYDQSHPQNELATGSGLVMPTDFDAQTLDDHLPACFIATPVLKAVDRTQIPGIEFASGLLNWYNRNSARSYFIYGGYWKGQYVSPAGLELNSLYGRSTNQEMLNGSKNMRLAVNDFVFLRPTQSEFVFLQFGDIAVYNAETQSISDMWPVFNQTA